MEERKLKRKSTKTSTNTAAPTGGSGRTNSASSGGKHADNTGAVSSQKNRSSRRWAARKLNASHANHALQTLMAQRFWCVSLAGGSEINPDISRVLVVKLHRTRARQHPPSNTRFWRMSQMCRRWRMACSAFSMTSTQENYRLLVNWSSLERTSCPSIHYLHLLSSAC